MNFATTTAIAVAASVTAAFTASVVDARTIYEYEATDFGATSDNAGQITQFGASYATDQMLSLSASIDLRDDRPTVNGGWFVLSPGTLPTETTEELAIFYMDLNGGDLYAYQYNGASAEASWVDHDRYITTYEDVLSVENDGASLSVAFSDLFVGAVQDAVEGAAWTGASFAEQFGAWVHFTALDEFAQCGGFLTAFDIGWQSYIDVHDRDTTTVAVPEPAGLAAFGLFGVLGAAAYRRRAS